MGVKGHTESTEITERTSQARMGEKGHTDLTDYTDFASQAKEGFKCPAERKEIKEMGAYFLFKERSKYLSFSWRKKRTKRTSTLTKPSPIWEGCN